MEVAATMRIGDAARASGVSVANIRYYEQQGLLAPAVRSDSGYRHYGPQDVHRLRFIRMCRGMDMSLDEVRTLLALDLRQRADCDRARSALDEHLGHVRQRMNELRVLEKDLLVLRDSCDGRGDHCHIIEALHQRAQAQSPQSLKQPPKQAPKQPSKQPSKQALPTARRPRALRHV